MRKLSVITGFAGLLGALACGSDTLTVPNNNQPDAARVLARPTDVESLVAGSFNTAWQATVGGSLTSLQPAMSVMSFENSSSLANFNMGTLGSLPRNKITNRPGGVFSSQNYYNFRNLSSAARSAATGLVQSKASGFTLGSSGADNRMKSFGFFVLGFANSNNALLYDSIPLVTEKNGDDPKPPLIGTDSAIKLGLNQFDSAITYATAGMTPLPTTWIPGNGFTQTQFIAFIRAYKARYRALQARTPAARAAVNWTAVRDDAVAATAVFTSDIQIQLDPSKSWDYTWYGVHFNFDTWHQQSPIMIGMADSSGGYDNWLSTPLTSRTPFLIQTADQRFPAGNTRAAQQAASLTGTESIPPRTNLYFRNRTTSADVLGEPYANSQYDWYRMQALKNASDIGSFPMLQKAELDLLAAEGFYRLGDFANAAARINVSRVNIGKLPPLTASAGTVPGGAACVPRIPDPAQNFAKSKCGDMFEALKWEKRMELAFTQFGAWYFDSRGWGDLAKGTATEWPVPFQEMQVRAQPFYDQLPSQTAPQGNYGY
ncbi:MAG: hypothetical protein H0W63_06240 [Gemmatimonadaceae bacterium]|nr:hypothetical protein [Gemmatimonadaceae bacterium]